MKEKVAVGLSGGVDSSVSALLLKKAGYDVVGITMSIWGEQKELPKSTKNACYGPDEQEDIQEAQKICNQLQIPYQVFDCAKKYSEIVLENFKQEYLSGRTPNPCIWCNNLVKFGTLPTLAKESGLEFDKFATGHYARVEYDSSNSRYILKKAVDEKKDQSYFLYRLTQEQLSQVLFPLGELTKEQVRDIAKENSLHVHDKGESQDFYCGDYNDLLGVKPVQGNIVDKEGNILGTHNGIWNYTLGQRKGIGIAYKEPLYVVALDKCKNQVIVGTEQDTYSRSLIATDLSWIAFKKPESEFVAEAKIRSTHRQTPVKVNVLDDKTISVEFIESQKAVTTGQSIVLYDGDIVLGGGIIDNISG